MKLPRRKFLHLAAGSAALPAISLIARAQTYPTRAVTLIVFVSAGGTPDIIARLIGQSLSQRLGQSVVIDNRPGGGGNLALQAVARAPADGYTLLLVATRTPSTRRYMRRALSPSRATSSRSRASTTIPSPYWSIPRSRPKPSPSSSPMPRPIRARSTLPRTAPET